ncbi:MAG: DUF4340 domain-containing protein, partial [Acidobacteria bacterium]|nr:DUF4340 domain-containing protein [Acidobacteriota bacterium]
FLALAAFVYFYEIQGEEKREEVRQLEESLLRLKQPEITAVEISPFQKESIALIKEGDRWMIERPIRSIADMGTLGSLLRDLESASRDRILTDAGSDIEKYGLDRPRFRLTIGVGQERKILLIGNNDFTGNSMYVQLEGDPEVFLTSRSLTTAVDKELFQWRDKKVLVFERPQVQTIELENAEATIRLERRDEEWFLEAPLRERADQNKVRGLLSTVEFAEIQEFVDDFPEELESYGLVPARATLRIQLDDPLMWRTLELGQKRGEYSLARNSDWPFVFTVKPELSDRLNETVWDFRDKSVVDVDQTEIAQVLFRRVDDEDIIIKFQDYTWTVEKPDSHRDQEVQAYKFWYPITDIRFQSIDDHQLDEPSLSQPEVRMVVTFKDGAERSVVFAQAGDRYLARKVSTGRQGTISQTDFEKLLFKIEDIVAAAL